MKKKGFTLVELLAVIAILAILVIMALPAVLQMFNKARIDSFSNELNTIVKTSRQQYLIDGGNVKRYSNTGGSSISLTGDSNLQYYVEMNDKGNITKLQAIGNDFQYDVSNPNGIDIINKSDIKVRSQLNENELLTIDVKAFQFINRQNEGTITQGDEVAIGSEHFYVVSSNSSKTTLLAKYNLLVGDIFNLDESNWIYTYVRTLNNSDSGYGLQNELAKGYIKNSGTVTGIVPFSGTNYWDDSVCVWPASGYNCTGTENLSSGYSGSYNGNPYPNVYRSDLSNTAPEMIYGNAGSKQGWGKAQNNGYTISYFVEPYVKKIKELGASNNTTGRLLTYEELISILSGNNTYTISNVSACESYFKDFGYTEDQCHTLCSDEIIYPFNVGMKYNISYVPESDYEAAGLSNVNIDLSILFENIVNTSFWLSTAPDLNYIWVFFSNGNIVARDTQTDSLIGVRPVIEINTSDL